SARNPTQSNHAQAVPVRSFYFHPLCASGGRSVSLPSCFVGFRAVRVSIWPFFSKNFQNRPNCPFSAKFSFISGIQSITGYHSLPLPCEGSHVMTCHAARAGRIRRWLAAGDSLPSFPDAWSALSVTAPDSPIGARKSEIVNCKLAKHLAPPPTDAPRLPPPPAPPPPAPHR